MPDLESRFTTKTLQGISNILTRQLSYLGNMNQREDVRCRDISLAITHIEDGLLRLDKAIKERREREDGA